MNKWVSVQIPIPGSRVPEFFEMFGRWIRELEPTRDERPKQGPKIAFSSWQDGSEDQQRQDAQYVYTRVSSAARAILDYWLDHPGTPVSGEDLSAALGFAGPHVISGTLASLGHRSRAVHRELPFRYEPAPGGGKYWIEPDVAKLFTAARSLSASHETRALGDRRQGWTAVEDLRPHLQPIVAALGRMPTQRDLAQRGRRDLSSGIQKFGGFQSVADALGYPYHGRRSWETIEDLRPHLDPIVADLGRMPTQVDLQERGGPDLIRAIHKFGGWRRISEVLGYPYAGLPTWSSMEDLRTELDPIVAEVGTMPNRRELASRGRPDLASAIAKFGGFTSVAETLGYEH
jgi:hypothetical protein